MSKSIRNNILISYLGSLGLYIDFYSICPSLYDDVHDYNSLYELLDDNQLLSINVIYYSNAIAFLSNNDASLKRSLALAAELNYNIEYLDSELLASLLASDMLCDGLNDMKNEINEFFEELDK